MAMKLLAYEITNPYLQETVGVELYTVFVPGDVGYWFACEKILVI